MDSTVSGHSVSNYSSGVQDDPEDKNKDPLALKSRLSSAVFYSSMFAFLAVGPLSVIDFLPSPLKALCPLIWGLSVCYQHYLVTRQRPTKPEKEDLLTTMLSTEFRPGLLKIMNSLDPKSFVIFSRTCKSIRIITQSSKGIRVPFHGKLIVDGRSYLLAERVRLKFLNRTENCYCTIVGLMLKNLQKMPFEFKFEIVAKQNLTNFEVITNFLTNFKRYSICQLTVKVNEVFITNVDWRKLAYFIENLNIKRLHLPFERLPIPPEFIHCFLKLPIENLECKVEIPLGIVQNLKHEYLSLHGTDLKAVDFKSIIQEILDGRLSHINMWTFYTVNSDLQTTEAFLSCFEGIRSIAFDFSEELPQERPLLTYEQERNYSNVHVLTSGDKLYTFSKETFTDVGHSVGIYPASEFYNEIPAALRPFLDDE